MKLTVRREQLNETPENFLHHAGWGMIHDRRRGVDSFVKRLGSGFYPRLHLYVDERDGLVIFNMHLDQKEASYAGSHMHNAEYDSELVAAEIGRIKGSLGIASSQLSKQAVAQENRSAGSVNISKPRYSQGSLADDLAELKNSQPKSFWQRLLGL